MSTVARLIVRLRRENAERSKRTRIRKRDGQQSTKSGNATADLFTKGNNRQRRVASSGKKIETTASGLTSKDARISNATAQIIVSVQELEP
jgi:hypothetical protein